MPYKSEAQRKFLHAVKPSVAARFDREIREAAGLKRKAKRAASTKKKK